ncbi:sodium channel and clathrin linker 1 isoform X2 [Thalassophryne amazonica]|uniref:sodium channel and clathrin linker 1 isoform X2 n=1 Tax=Thalassophryne amazonica TaxID=390379 RepID=UPI001471E1CA|nr:sodium channel and clathrin linker 1 isoform X2 [Thalassophryne amazonica]
MEEEVQFLQDQVKRLNSALGQYQNASSSPFTLAQVEESKPPEPGAPWISDRRIMTPLLADYDRHIDTMTEQLQRYKAEMTDIKKKMQQIIKENEGLHAELHESIETQIKNLSKSGSDVDDVIKNLREQLQLSEQEREQAMNLWQMAAVELNRLQADHQRIITDGQEQEAQQQQLQDQLAQWQRQAQSHQLANQKLKSRNQEFLKTVTEQATEMSELFDQRGQFQAELKMAQDELSSATAKVDEMAKRLQSAHEQLKKQEQDTAKALCQQEAAERRLQHFKLTVSEMETRVKVACEEREAVLSERTTWEQKMSRLLERCASLEQEKFEAVAKVGEAVQMSEEAVLDKDEAVFREKQRLEELEKTKEATRQLIQDAAVRTRKEVENVRQECNLKITFLIEEASDLQLECANKDLLVQRLQRERKNLEAELEKMRREGGAEVELRKIEALQQRCLLAERSKEDIGLSLKTTKKKLKDMEKTCNEKLSLCQDEVRRLQGCLDADRHNSAKINEERLELQQENQQLRTELMELRKSTTLAEKKAKLKISQVEQRCSMKEAELTARMLELEESSRSSSAMMEQMFVAQQKKAQSVKEDSIHLIQVSEAKIKDLTNGNTPRVWF